MESRKRIQPRQRRESDLITAILREKLASRISIMAQRIRFEASAGACGTGSKTLICPTKKGPEGPFGVTWKTGKF
jgi:hypothetical protein